MFQAVVSRIVGDDLTRLEKLVEAMRKCPSEVKAVSELIAQLSDSLQSRQGGILDRLTEIATSIGSPDYSKLYQVMQTYTHDDLEPSDAPTNVYKSILEQSNDAGSLNRINWKHVNKLPGIPKGIGRCNR